MLFSNPPISIKITPKPGFCVKLKATSNEKVFVNVCSDEKVPKPRNVTEQELTKILEDVDNAPLYKIPMSVSEAHEEMDKVGNKCIAYDVIINDQFMKTVRDSQLFEAFLMTVIIEGLEQKYSLSLERSWIVLKNKTHHGTLLEQMVRADSRPKIEEIDKHSIANKLISLPTDCASVKPSVEFSYVPSQDRPEFIIASIDLPKLVSSRY
ncbi:PIH1 domain-containing protein 1 [Cichlidogyrus casuarinus]|uniref:PIH1 domain-containing protein 1 n=1 Tax=Cichlidogyrus casuarinus TaxID=1844966 RepID=A0ABD2Q7H6_9PLAT